MKNTPATSFRAVPVMVTVAPTGPEAGLRLVMTGTGSGARLPWFRLASTLPCSSEVIRSRSPSPSRSPRVTPTVCTGIAVLAVTVG